MLLMQTSMQNNDFTASYWCKFTRGLNIVRDLGFNIFEGRNGKPLFIRECSGCNGAHNMAQFKCYQDNYTFNHIHKNKYNWIELYHAMIKTLQTDSAKLKDATDKQSITSCLEQNFFDILMTWKTLSTKYRKEIEKCEEAGTNHSFPSFTLPDEMDMIAMSLERTTHLCQHTIKMNNAIRTFTKIDISDICLGTGMNCKFGVNLATEMLCTVDFMTGTCGCPKKDYIETRTTELTTTLVELKKQLAEVEQIDSQPVVTANKFEFTTINKPKNKKAVEKLMFRIQDQIKQVTLELKQIKNTRMIHYTDTGMVPFEKQLQAYTDMKAEEERMASAKLQSLDDLIKVTQQAKPIVSLGKLGKKK